MLTVASQQQYLSALQEQCKQQSNSNTSTKTQTKDDTIIG